MAAFYNLTSKISIGSRNTARDLSGKTLYLVDETFDGGDKFLQQMQAWMAIHMPDVKAEFREKKGSYAADDPNLWKEIKSVNGLMVMATGHWSTCAPAVVGPVAEVEAHYGIPAWRHHRCLARSGSRQGL